MGMYLVWVIASLMAKISFCHEDAGLDRWFYSIFICPESNTQSVSFKFLDASVKISLKSLMLDSWV